MNCLHKLILCGAVALATVSARAQDAGLPIYLNTAYSFEERATDLVSRLTLEEKQSLLGNNMAAVPRLGLKNYNVWSEALHGVLSGANPAAGLLGPTSFPNSVAIGSTWDPALAEWMASAIADEARAIFQTGTKGLTFWSPVVEPVRDPRWGRTGESYGEDPFLAAEMARGFVRGLMGNDPKYLKAVPTAKHYFANNSEFDRHVSSSNMDSRDMREFYLYPYKRLIEDEHLPSIMSSYNAVNHIPTTAGTYYIDTLARAIKSRDEEVCETWRTICSKTCGEDKICVRTFVRMIGKTDDHFLFYAMVQNITKEKELFNELFESERRFRYSSEQANVYAWEVNLVTRVMHPCFRCMRDLKVPATVLNYPEPLIENGLFPPDYADMYRDWMNQLEKGEVDSLEAVIHLTVGRIPFYVRYTLERDENGNPMKAYGSATYVINENK